MTAQSIQKLLISEAEILKKKGLVESVFNQIYLENMQDIPVINDKLKVTAIGFQQYEELYIGVVVTPWFMNIIILPIESNCWVHLPELSQHSFTFPSGQYTFVVGKDKQLGTYQMCSLFSPMFEFANNETALETATIAIRELMNEDNIENSDIDSAQIERIWNGEENMPEVFEDKTDNKQKATEERKQEDETPAENLTENIKRPISRRSMLSGSFLKTKDSNDD